MRSLLFVLVALTACSSEAPEPSTTPGPRKVASGNAAWEKSGAAPVGHAIFSARDTTRDRTLTMQVWYPATSGGGTAIEDLVIDDAQRASMVKLLANAPATCTRKRVDSARDAVPAAGSFPLIAFSHCHGCTRFSAAAIAERLASHGFAVIAPDHATNTVFDNTAPLNGEFLATRAADIKFAIDTALNAPPAVLNGKFDANSIGMFGHSYGAATTGLVLARDARIKAGVAIAAPMENDLLPPAKMAEIKVPTMFLLAREDNSISEIGNNLIRSNFQRGNPPIWLQEIDDAGHWSFSDICALTENLRPGCGEGTRQTESGENFFYLENESARALAASYVTAFFLAHLRADTNARAFLSAKHPSGVVTTSVR
jgi:predicted dienelactone hydrolase